jgi:hypothetical protein
VSGRWLGPRKGAGGTSTQAFLSQSMTLGQQLESYTTAILLACMILSYFIASLLAFTAAVFQ